MLILAGGFGTRLREAVSDVPKPLAPVHGVPYLRYLLEQWIAQGLTAFTFLLHHQAEMIQRFLDGEAAHGVLRGCRWQVVVEAEPLGTGGAIAHAVRHTGLEEEFLVANADTWLGGGVHALADATAPAVAIVEVPDASRYGCVRTEGDRIVGFEEKRQQTEPAWINAGMYRLHGSLFHDWNGRPFSLEREIFPSLAANGRLQAVRVHDHFIDIGVPEDYRRFCRWIESGKAGPP